MDDLERQIKEHRERVFTEARRQLAEGHEYIAIPGMFGGEPVHRSIVERGLELAQQALVDGIAWKLTNG